MNPASQAFLLEEYRALWHHIEHLDSTRSKAVLLYLAALGGVLGGVAGLALRPPTQPNMGLYGVLTTLPSVALFSALCFVLVTSVVILRIWIQFRSLSVEYTYSLNMICRAFEHADRSLHPFLVLPTRMPQVPLGTRGAARDIYLFLCVVSASFVWLTAVSVSYRAGYHGMWVPLTALLPSLVWVGLFYLWYQEDLQTTLDNLWARCEETGVKEEIATRAYQLWLLRRDDEIANWLSAEEEVEARWGRLARPRSWCFRRK